MPTIKIDNLSHSGLKDFYRTMLLLDDAVYFRAEDGELRTSMYTPNKDTALYRTVPLESVFKTSDTTPFRVGLHKGVPGKMLKYLDRFKDGSTTAEIHTYTHRSDGRTYARKIDMADGRLRMSVMCADPAVMFVEMSNDQVNKAFSSSSGASPFYKFEIESGDLKDLVKLSELLPDDSSQVALVCDGSSVSAKCELFEMKLPGSPSVEPGFVAGTESSLFRRFFTRIPVEGYAVTVYRTKMVMEAASGNLKMAINLALQA